MRTKALILCTAMMLASAPASHAQRGAAGTVVAIVGARLIDGTGTAVDDSVILVAGERITAAGARARVAVPQGATVVNAAGKSVIPGLIDVHCHLNQPPEIMRKLLPIALNWGVTTIRMVGNDKPENMEVYSEAKAGQFLSPRAFSAGQGFNLTGPYPGAPTFKPATPDEARANVQRQKQLKVDFVKIWMSDKGGFAPEIIAAIVDEARKQNLPVVAHIGSVAQVRQLADLGVTDFLHEARDGITPEFIAYAKQKRLSFAPTLANGEARWFYYENPQFLKMSPRFDGWYAKGRAMLSDDARRQQVIGAADFAQTKQRFKEQNYPFIKAMSDAGVRIVTGTDCGAEASQVTPVGHATHREIAMLVEAGMTPAAALRAATLDAARVLERTDDPAYGSIAAGKVADLVVLNADPLADINNTIKIDRVMKAGTWVP